MNFTIHQPNQIYSIRRNDLLRKPLLLYDDLEKYIKVYGLPEYVQYIQRILKDIRNVINSIQTYPERAFVPTNIEEPVSEYYHFTIQVDYYWKRYINPFISPPDSIPLVWSVIDNHIIFVPPVRKYLEQNIIEMKQYWQDLIHVLEDILPISHIDEMFIKDNIDTIRNFIITAERKYSRNRIIKWVYSETTRFGTTNCN